MGKKTAQQPQPAPAPSPYDNAHYFPFASYAATVGVHASLHGFSALFLPRTPGIAEFLPEVEFTSQDRPQAEFMEALTRSPAATLLCMLLGAVILQSWWGGWLRAWRIESLLQGSTTDKALARTRVNARKLLDLRDAWLATILASAVFFSVLILLGAPLSSHVPQTYLLAAVLAILTTFVPAYTLGSPFDSTVTRLTWLRIFAELSSRSPVERAILYPALGTVVGSWLGVIPIALDWDRPWQAWPLTPAFGAVAGYILASVAAISASAVRFLAEEHVRAEKLKTQ
ncbi:hypothetical protein HMN09_00299600 [Mycena chlorophos]|uniref:Uncharacterized protein n=1 Tax=Mycena chlorophos TaxID=658473 RepID=A0A8H6TIJ4_MYCCL|nr:hypothetical protein HMN09_00299600 [Mycena chlorophos]